MNPLQVYCGGAVKIAVTAAAADFQEQTGITVDFTYGPVGKLKQAILGGKQPDVMVLSRPALQALEQVGRIEAGTIVDLGTAAVGIVIPKDHAKVDVSSVQALRAALLAAKSITYGNPAHGDSSGIHFSSVIDRLGIRQALEARTVLASMGLEVVDKVAQGQAELGATQSTIILANDRVVLAGLLPQELQHTTTYAVGLAKGASTQARALFTAIQAARTHVTLNPGNLHA